MLFGQETFILLTAMRVILCAPVVPWSMGRVVRRLAGSVKRKSSFLWGKVPGTRWHLSQGGTRWGGGPGGEERRSERVSNGRGLIR